MLSRVLTTPSPTAARLAQVEISPYRSAASEESIFDSLSTNTRHIRVLLSDDELLAIEFEK